MKQKLTILILAVLSMFLMLDASSVLLAQDTLDVAPGYETLNLAIEADTLAPNPNRVYRLERNGFYLLNGTIKGVGVPLRIVAAKGSGPKPILVSAADQAGNSPRYFRPGVDGEWRGLYISGIDNLGNQVEDNTFRCEKEGGRYIIDDCYVDGDAQSFVRMNAKYQKFFITNTIFANSYLISNPSNGRFLDTRGNTQDTVFVQNCTFVNCTADGLRNGGGIVKYFFFDHVTMSKGMGWGSEFEIDRNIFCQITNNLFHDAGWEGRELMSVDSTDDCVVPIDSLNAPDLATEEQRLFTVRNNVMGWSSDIKAWITGKDSLQLYPWTDYMGNFFFTNYPNFVFENNIMEDVVFSDGPENTLHLAYMEHRFNDNYANNNNPNIRLDRNGVGTLIDNPETFGPAADDYDFDYATTFAAYSHAMGGFPAGDLNWFPDKKAEWETWVTDVEFISDVIPTEFNLAQNYPNPFNPSTSIAYGLNNRAAVTLAIYNVLGQKVRTLVNNKQQIAGSYVVKWDGRNDAGLLVPSGMYVYRLEGGDRVLARKMLMLK